jgi:hypothetical protein
MPDEVSSYDEPINGYFQAGIDSIHFSDISLGAPDNVFECKEILWMPLEESRSFCLLTICFSMLRTSLSLNRLAAILMEHHFNSQVIMFKYHVPTHSFLTCFSLSIPSTA